MEKDPRDTKKLKFKKLTRIQLLREDEILASILYKTTNQLRQWPGLKRIKWALKITKCLAKRGRGLVVADIEHSKEGVTRAGLEIRSKIVEGWLLPAMTLLYASMSRLYRLLEATETMDEREIKEERLEGLSKAAMASLNTIVINVPVSEPVIVHRRRIEANEIIKYVETFYIFKPEEPTLTIDETIELNEVKEPAIDSHPVKDDDKIPSSSDMLVSFTALADSVQAEADCQLTSGTDQLIDYHQQIATHLVKRRPTRVPHSPLRHLRRITKLIKKA